LLTRPRRQLLRFSSIFASLFDFAIFRYFDHAAIFARRFIFSFFRFEAFTPLSPLSVFDVFAEGFILPPL